MRKTGPATSTNLASRILKMHGTMVGPDLKDAPYEWTFHFPADIGEGVRFSTNPESACDRMWSWAYRVDGGIHEGRLYFLCFKKREMTSGKMVTLDGQHWFDGKCWAALQSGPRDKRRSTQPRKAMAKHSSVLSLPPAMKRRRF